MKTSPVKAPEADVVLMFKVLILQHLYNFPDDELEYQIRDRYSFCRFLGLTPEYRVPDARTIWLFREQLTRQGLIEELFIDFDLQLDEKGFEAQKGQIVDATIVRAPRQHNNREENRQIKSGDIPERFKEKPAVGSWADSACAGEEKVLLLSASGYRSHVHQKGKRNGALTDSQQASNRKKSRIRARFVHVFGSMEMNKVAC